MADLGEEVNNVSGVYGGVEFNGEQNNEQGQQFEQASTNVNEKNLPVKRGFWSSFKAFWLQDINWNKEIRVELTPKQQKVFQEVHDFWTQEITGQSVHDFLFYDITGEKVKNFLFQEIEITGDIEF